MGVCVVAASCMARVSDGEFAGICWHDGLVVTAAMDGIDGVPAFFVSSSSVNLSLQLQYSCSN